MTDSVEVTVLTREECHLCSAAVETIRRVADSVPREVDVTLVDVDTDPDLEREYGDRVPYVLVDGRPQFKYRVDEAALRERLSRENP